MFIVDNLLNFCFHVKIFTINSFEVAYVSFLRKTIKAPEHDHPCRLFLHIRFFDCFCHIDQEFYSFDEPI